MTQSQHGSGVVAETIRRYETLGVEFPRDLQARLERRIAPSGLADLEPGGSPQALVDAWLAGLSAPKDEDEVWLVLLTVFKTRFKGFTLGLQEALVNSHLGVAKTRIQIWLQLGGRCFHLGRRLDAQNADSPTGRSLLEECVDLLEKVAETEAYLKPEVRRKYRGQLANALTILSRRSPATGKPISTPKAWFCSKSCFSKRF